MVYAIITFSVILAVAFVKFWKSPKDQKTPIESNKLDYGDFGVRLIRDYLECAQEFGIQSAECHTIIWEAETEGYVQIAQVLHTLSLIFNIATIGRDEEISKVINQYIKYRLSNRFKDYEDIYEEYKEDVPVAKLFNVINNLHSTYSLCTD